MICTACGHKRDPDDICCYTGGVCVFCMDRVRNTCRTITAQNNPESYARRQGPQKRRKKVNWEKSISNRRRYEAKRRQNGKQ